MTKKIWIALVVAVVATSPVLAQEKGMPGGLVRSSHVIGMDVRNAANENMGDIKDIVLDKDKGTIAYAVVSFGGFLNMGDKLFAVPWESLKPSSDNKALVLDIPKDRLEKAPGFESNNWPNMANAQWSSEIRTFYGASAVARTTEPSTGPARREDGMNGVGRDDGATGRRDDAKADDRGRYDDPNRDKARDDGLKHDNGMRRDESGMKANGNGHRQTVSHVGTIKSFERGDPSRLVITTTSGEINADLGSASLLEKNQLRFDNGAQITVRGYETAKDGRTTFVVTEVISNDRTVALQRSDATQHSGEVAVSSNGNGTTATSQYPIRELNGTVTYIESGACEESAYGRQVTIRTTDGERIVALAPGTYLDSRRWVLNPRDTITVRGYDYDRNGGRVFIATDLRRGNDTWTFRRADLTPVWGR